ncbi:MULTISPECIES: hypothetical protein [unclassified Streptomyces]|nr:hypothetical protein [Streptomyces sp. sk2.1]
MSMSSAQEDGELLAAPVSEQAADGPGSPSPEMMEPWTCPIG